MKANKTAFYSETKRILSPLNIVLHFGKRLPALMELVDFFRVQVLLDNVSDAIRAHYTR